MAPTAVVISYRLGGDDGVSVEARKWTWALAQLGFAVRRIAGLIEGPPAPDDIELPALRINPVGPATLNPSEMSAAVDGADLVIADNICSLPINPVAARAVADALDAHPGRVIYRHHDLPWQRRQLRAYESEFPPRQVGAMHATINLRSRRELEARGYDAVTIHNYFNLEAPLGDREASRNAFGFADDELVLFQPARAIERKNVPGGIRFAQRLLELMPDRRIRYWLSGPAEDGYAPTLERIIDASPVPVTLGRAHTAADAYAASDLVCVPSTWEGFGNPTVESIWAGRPCAAFAYPVLAEIVATGIRVFSVHEPEQVVRFLRDTPEAKERYFQVNRRRAKLSFSIEELPVALEQAFIAHGWAAW